MSNSLSFYDVTEGAGPTSSEPGNILALVPVPPSSDAVNLVPRTVADSPIDQHPAAVYLARLSLGSRDTMARSLNVVAAILTSDACDMRTLCWAALRYQHTAAVRAALAERYAPATANKMLAALRGVLKEAWRLGQMSAEDYHRAADTQTVRGSTLPKGRALNTGEIEALFAACASQATAIGVRDAAMLAVLYNCGLRRSELIMLSSFHSG